MRNETGFRKNCPKSIPSRVPGRLWLTVNDLFTSASSFKSKNQKIIAFEWQKERIARKKSQKKIKRGTTMIYF